MSSILSTCTRAIKTRVALSQNLLTPSRYAVARRHLAASPNRHPTKGGSQAILNGAVRDFVEQHAAVMQPAGIHVVDGSREETDILLAEMQKSGMVQPVPKLHNCWYARTDPLDVARVESKTVMVTGSERETRPIPPQGVKGQLNIWMSPDQFKTEVQERFPGCMKGRTMYVIPFSMGPVGSPLAKIGVQLTDSPYVVASMGIMTRMGQRVWDTLGQSKDYIKCVHSIGAPLPLKDGVDPTWPCNPGKVLVGHLPKRNEIISFGSGYGGNSLLGKKCFALRIASCLARKEGWLAEHMLIMGVTNPKGEKKYIAAAFPSACGKTNMAMMKPSLPGWKVECVGDDIAWMRFDKSGQLRAINPEAGFFGVAPGTSQSTNPFAMDTIMKNTVFTNVAQTSEGGVWWEGMGVKLSPDVGLTDWKGKPFDASSKASAAHPNSRFCAPAGQCPIMDPAWEDEAGVPIDAIIFGGRRPQGLPLVYEAFNWQHGVFVGASMRSEATAAAEYGGKQIMHDPFAMRPFFGYNFGHYLQHWLDFADSSKHGNLKLPKLFHVNWFRKSATGGFLWPGFGENARVIEWIFKRLNNDKSVMRQSPIGLLPTDEGINVDGLKEKVDMKQLFEVDKDFWSKEADSIDKYLTEQVNEDLPSEIRSQLDQLRQRVRDM